MYLNKYRSELCRNCVRSLRNHPQTPTFRGSHQAAFCGGKSLNRLRVEMFRYYSMQLAGIVFQACSFNHSDISPFRINDLRAVQNSVAQNPPSNSSGPQMDCLHRFAELYPAIVSGIVSDLQMSLDHLRRFGRAARRIVERPTIGRDDSRRQYIHCSLVWTAFVTPLIPVRLRSMKP